MMRKYWTLGLGALAGMVFPALAWAQVRTDYVHGPHGWGEGWHGGGMVMGFFMMILIVAIIAGLIVLVVKWIGGGKGGGSESSSREALDTLRDRFARGEIDAAEFEERKRVLTE
jgi:putative membrane protein